jgi:hypothetical protein
LVLRGSSAGWRKVEGDKEKRKQTQLDFAEQAPASRRSIPPVGRCFSREYDDALIFHGRMDAYTA